MFDNMTVEEIKGEIEDLQSQIEDLQEEIRMSDDSEEKADYRGEIRDLKEEIAEYKLKLKGQKPAWMKSVKSKNPVYDSTDMSTGTGRMKTYIVTGLRWHGRWTMIIEAVSKESARRTASKLEGVSVPSISVHEREVKPFSNPWLAKKGNEVAVFHTRFGVMGEMKKTGGLVGGGYAPWGRFIPITAPRRKPGRPKKGEPVQEQYNPTPHQSEYWGV